MRRFHSYGPVNCQHHFCVPREALIRKCCETLIGDPGEGGHYFTLWAPRQTGKTWLMQQVKEHILKQYPRKFAVLSLSFGRLRGMRYSPTEESGVSDLPRAFAELFQAKLPGHPELRTWQDFYGVFSKERELWDRPLLLFIDEVDTVSATLVDLMVAQFRELYLEQETNWLHGVALIGVRAVLGIESQRGSPFNIQRSFHVPAFTLEEVQELYRQYQEESGQTITPAVVDQVYHVTRGQPGLVSWFGELLTETYNPGPPKAIDVPVWDDVYHRACHTEFNTTILNLITKARTTYRPYVLELFSRADVPFSLDVDWCNYLYLHGLIDTETSITEAGQRVSVCRFASPFVQHRLYNALTYDLFEAHSPILALDPLDELADVLDGDELDVPALLRRYKDYLARLKAAGLNPWREQPRRKTDLHLTEAVGHFHLYSWLQAAVGRRCVVTPEFPTGNGKVDIHVRCGGKRGIIEIKSFVDAYEAKRARVQAAHYANSLGLGTVSIAMFVPVEDETVLEKLAGDDVIHGVRVIVVTIGWT